MAIRTVHHRPDWYSLTEAYQASYEMAKNNQIAYLDKSRHATETMRNHASSEIIKEKLEHFLNEVLESESSFEH